MYSYFALFMCAILAFSAISLSFGNTVSAAKEKTYTEELIAEDSLFSPDSDIIKFLEGIEQLPPGIEKQGPEKTAKWLSKKTGLEVTTDGENLYVPSLANLDLETELTYDDSLITTFGTADCIIAVGLMIGTVGFPFSKLYKLKKAIDYLGGVTATVKRIYNNYNKFRSWTTPKQPLGKGQ